MSDAAKINIAVVDDDASLCHAMDRLLRAAGFQPFTYVSAEAFLQQSEGVRPDCILLDIQLGGMSGFELQSFLAAWDRPFPLFSSQPTTILKPARRHGKPIAARTCEKTIQGKWCSKLFEEP